MAYCANSAHILYLQNERKGVFEYEYFQNYVYMGANFSHTYFKNMG